jgi:ribonucleoside-diphosphate reductase beta chain
MREYLQYIADRRLEALQDIQKWTDFFERRVSAYQVGVTGDVGFDDEF